MLYLYCLFILILTFTRIRTSSTLSDYIESEEVILNQTNGLTMFIHKPNPTHKEKMQTKQISNFNDGRSFFIIMDLREDTLRNAFKFAIKPSDPNEGIRLASCLHKYQYITKTYLEMETSFIYFLTIKELNNEDKLTLNQLLNSSLVKKANQEAIFNIILKNITHKDLNVDFTIKRLKAIEKFHTEFVVSRATECYPGFEVTSDRAFNYATYLDTETFGELINLKLEYFINYKNNVSRVKNISFKRIYLCSPTNKHWARINFNKKGLSTSSASELLNKIEFFTKMGEISEISETTKKDNIIRPKFTKKTDFKQMIKNNIFYEKELEKDNSVNKTPEIKKVEMIEKTGDNKKLSSFSKNNSFCDEEILSFSNHFNNNPGNIGDLKTVTFERRIQSQPEPLNVVNNVKKYIDANFNKVSKISSEQLYKKNDNHNDDDCYNFSYNFCSNDNKDTNKFKFDKDSKDNKKLEK